MTRKELKALKLTVSSGDPQSTNLPWAKLKKLLLRGVRGPDVSR